MAAGCCALLPLALLGYHTSYPPPKLLLATADDFCFTTPHSTSRRFSLLPWVSPVYCHLPLAQTPDTHTRSGRLHSSHPPRSSPARLPAALHLAIRSGVLGRCPLHHHPHSHPGETREKRPQEPPSTHTTRGTPGFLPGSPPGDKPGFVTSPGFSQGYGKCGFLVFSRVALSGVDLDIEELPCTLR